MQYRRSVSHGSIPPYIASPKRTAGCARVFSYADCRTAVAIFKVIYLFYVYLLTYSVARLVVDELSIGVRIVQIKDDLDKPEMCCMGIGQGSTIRPCSCIMVSGSYALSEIARLG